MSAGTTTAEAMREPLSRRRAIGCRVAPVRKRNRMLRISLAFSARCEVQSGEARRRREAGTAHTLRFSPAYSQAFLKVGALAQPKSSATLLQPKLPIGAPMAPPPVDAPDLAAYAILV